MYNNIPNISMQKVEELIQKGIYLIVERDDKRYIKFLNSKVCMNDKNRLYESIFSKDVISNGFEIIEDFDEEIESIFSGLVYYDKEINMSIILSQLPITVQDSIYAIEILGDKDYLERTNTCTGFTEAIKVYRKKSVPKNVYDNNLKLAEIYNLAKKNVDLYYIKGKKTYFLDCKSEFFRCLNLTIEEVFEKFSKEEEIDFNPNYLRNVFYKISNNKGIELVDFLRQIPLCYLKEPNCYIVIRSPFEYTDLNKHRYIEEARERYLVYNYYTNIFFKNIYQ